MEKDSNGTRSIDRTIRILKAITKRPQVGWRLVDLAAECQLPAPTTHRIVTCLLSQRLVGQRPNDKRYVPGPLLFELALSLPTYSTFSSAVREDLMSVARKTQQSTFLWLRSGIEIVCIDKIATSTQTITRIGNRRPLTKSVFGIAIFMSLPKASQEEIRKSCETAGWPSRHSNGGYERILERSSKFGFAICRDDLILGRGSVAFPFHSSNKQPIGAIGITGHSSTFEDGRLEEVVRPLNDGIRSIEHKYAHLLEDISRAAA